MPALEFEVPNRWERALVPLHYALKLGAFAQIESLLIQYHIRSRIPKGTGLKVTPSSVDSKFILG